MRSSRYNCEDTRYYQIAMSLFVNAKAIRDWAEEIPARAALPHLCRRLVLATIPNASRIDFPAYESVQRSDFDGRVTCDKGNAWVPSGDSVWELSIESRV